MSAHDAAASPLSEERVREIRYRYEMELKHHGVDLLYVGALLGHIDAITADRTALTARLEAVERERDKMVRCVAQILEAVRRS